MQRIFPALCMLLVCGAMPAISDVASRGPAYVRQANGDVFRVDDGPILDVIQEAEGTSHGYNTVSNLALKKSKPDAPVSTMPLGELIAYMEKVRRLGAGSSAMGYYQVNYETLLDTMPRLKLNEDMIFSGAMQDRIARYKLQRCGFYDVREQPSDIANCIAHVWAGLPLASGKNKGLSRYKDTKKAPNRATVSVEAVLSAIEKRFPTPQKLILASAAKSKTKTPVSSRKIADRIPVKP